MLSMDTAISETPSETPISERRLAANRANAQLSTGPTSPEGKARSSLNAVKTGLCGRALLLADEEEARAYRAHVARVHAWWAPANVEEHALVQSLADTQWRLESIPGLESALYAQARLRNQPLPQHPDPAIQRLLLDAQAEVAEAKALKNLRLHERRLRRQYEKDKAELNELRNERLEQEEQERQEEAERQRREEQSRKRAERRKIKEAATTPAQPENLAEPELTPAGFEFSTRLKTGRPILAIHHQEQ
jgi:flagellar biosynthesis GTPase FlhF